MNNNTPFRARYRLLPAVAALACLSSCQTVDGWLKKDASANATTMASNSAQVPTRIEAIRAHDAEVARLTRAADSALAAGDLAAAGRGYRELAAYAPGNARAAEGLRRVEMRQRHAAMLAQAKAWLGQSDADDERAGSLLRSVLAENPDEAEAHDLYRALTARQQQRQADSLRKKLVYANPVSLEFRDVPLKVIIEALARGTGVNFIVDKDVRSDQKATLFVKNTPLEDAVDMLVQSNQLRKKVLNEHSVIIYPNTTLKLREYQDLVVRSFYLEHADPKTVGGMLKSMLGIRQVQTDDRLPMIMIKDVPEIMTLAEKLIASQDVPEPEVMLELEVIELKRSRNLDLGVTWPTQFGVLPQGEILTLQELKDLNSSAIGVTPLPNVVFNGADADANLLANPRVRIKNREKARIHIGDRVPVITANVTSTGVSTENVQYIDVGLKLEAEPTISFGGDVTLKLNLDVGSLGTATRTTLGSVVYQIGTRSASTQLRLKDGETQVLAGLINDEDRKSVNKLPGLGDIPLLGRLFANHGDQKSKTEIVLSVTPRIVRERRAVPAELTEYWAGSELNAGRALTAPLRAEGVPFVAGTPARPAAPAAPAAPDDKPRPLNIPLPAELTTPLSDGPGTREDAYDE